MSERGGTKTIIEVYPMKYIMPGSVRVQSEAHVRLN